MPCHQSLRRQGEHNYFIFYQLDGRKTRFKTKTSLGREPKRIAGDLLSHMAHQCKLTNDQFIQLIDCPLAREAYEQMLDKEGHL